MNEEADKRAMPDQIIYSTCSGFANFGEVGTRMSTDGDAEKGKNEFITVGNVDGIKRKWLTHSSYQNIQKVKEAFSSMKDDQVYGIVRHSESSELSLLFQYMEFFHERDPTGEKSKTVSEIIEGGLLPEKEIDEGILNEVYEALSVSQDRDNVGTNVAVGNNLCGDGVCDEIEQREEICPADCN